MADSPASRLIRAWLLTAVVDGLFSSVLSVAFYDSTVARLFQGVASTVAGPSAIDGGTAMTVLGVLMHLTVAFTWSAVFLLLSSRSAGIRRLLASPNGVIKTAAVYGPFVWIIMSMVVIPLLRQQMPTYTIRWLVQLIGHFPFVGLPIVSQIGPGAVRQARAV